jgi:hypothetical protein
MVHLKYKFILALLLLAHATVLAQLNCPDFKIRGNRSPRSNPFTTAIKFQLDGLAQYIGVVPEDVVVKKFQATTAFSMGVEQTLHRKISISAMHGWNMSLQRDGVRFLSADLRYFFERTFEGNWLSVRGTMTEGWRSGIRNGLNSFYSVHYGKTARRKLIFSHFEMGIGYAHPQIFTVMVGASTGLKLN